MRSKSSWAASISGVALFACLVAAPGHATVPSSADPGEPLNCSTASAPDPRACGVPGEVTVTEESYSPRGKLLTTRTFDHRSQDVLMGSEAEAIGGRFTAHGSGSGGTSSASGCKKVTVHNKRDSYFGALMYTWDTWTSWCWTRSTQNIYNVSTGQRFYPDTTTIDWHGVVDSEKIFYDYSTNNGYPRSAYKNWQQAKVSNVVMGATVGTIYPENLIRSYYNGTWVWSTVE